jgi:hypothetical protein
VDGLLERNEGDPSEDGEEYEREQRKEDRGETRARVEDRVDGLGEIAAVEEVDRSAGVPAGVPGHIAASATCSRVFSNFEKSS